MMNLADISTQYRQQANESFRKKGFRGMLGDLNKFLDEQIASKREKQKTEEARTYETEKIRQQQAFQSGEAEKARTAATDQNLMKIRADQEAARIEQERQQKQQEEKAAWDHQAQDAAISIYSDPNDPEVYRSSMAAIAEAIQHGATGDINAVTTQARMLRDELRTISDSKKLDRLDAANADVRTALDDWGSALPEEKGAAANAVARAITIAKLEGNTSPVLDSILNALPLDDEMPVDEGEPLSFSEQLREADLLSDPDKVPPSVRAVLPRLATTNADSAAVANAMITGIDRRKGAAPIQTQANQIRSDFLENKGRRKRNPLEAFNRVVTGAGADEELPLGVRAPESEPTGPAKRAYPEDKVVDAWVAVIEHSKVRSDARDRALQRITDTTVRKKVKERLGW